MFHVKRRYATVIKVQLPRFVRVLYRLSVATLIVGISSLLLINLIDSAELHLLIYPLVWWLLVAQIGFFSAIILARFVRCPRCGEQALLVPDADPKELERTHEPARRTCGHCGEPI